jgi:hypothetical protein
MSPTSRLRMRESNIFSVGYHNPTNIELSLINPKHWRKPFERTNVIMTSLSIRMSLQNIRREKTRVDSKRRDSIHSPTRIQGKVHTWVSQAGVCTNETSHPKVEINQQRRKEKE